MLSRELLLVLILSCAPALAQSLTGGIQEAINALPQPDGGVVTVSSSVQIAQTIFITNLQNITVRCLSGVAISVPPGSNFPIFKGTGFKNTVITGCNLVGPGAHYVSGSQPVLFFVGGDTLTIDHNQISGAAFDGMYLSGLKPTSNVYVHDNVVTGSGANGIECDAINCVVYNNTSNSNGYMGIEVYAPGNNAVVSSNVTQSNGRNGINIQSDPTTGSVHHVVITNNTTTDNLANGIQIGGLATFPIHHITILNNTVLRNVNVGINLNYTDLPIISNNTVQDNNFNHFSWSGGINFSGKVTNGILQANTVGNITSAGQQQYGIKIGDSNSINNLILNNSLAGNKVGPFYSVVPSTIVAPPSGNQILIGNN